MGLGEKAIYDVVIKALEDFEDINQTGFGSPRYEIVQSTSKEQKKIIDDLFDSLTIDNLVYIEEKIKEIKNKYPNLFSKEEKKK